MRLCVVACSVALAIAPAHAQPTTVTGTIDVPNPAATYEKRDVPSSAGITRNLSPCDPDGDLQGVDGYWIRVTPFQNHGAALTPAGVGSAVEDFDVYFYDHWCRVLSYDGMARGGPGVGPGYPEKGVVPVDAEFAQVTYWIGPPLGEFSVTFS